MPTRTDVGFGLQEGAGNLGAPANRWQSNCKPAVTYAQEIVPMLSAPSWLQGRLNMVVKKHMAQEFAWEKSEETAWLSPNGACQQRYSNINNSCRKSGRGSQVEKCPEHLPFHNHVPNTYCVQARSSIPSLQGITVGTNAYLDHCRYLASVLQRAVVLWSLTSLRSLKPLQHCQHKAWGKRGSGLLFPLLWTE